MQINDNSLLQGATRSVPCVDLTLDFTQVNTHPVVLLVMTQCGLVDVITACPWWELSHNNVRPVDSLITILT
jgi:hypothetical protein